MKLFLYEYTIVASTSICSVLTVWLLRNLSLYGKLCLRDEKMLRLSSTYMFVVSARYYFTLSVAFMPQSVDDWLHPHIPCLAFVSVQLIAMSRYFLRIRISRPTWASKKS